MKYFFVLLSFCTVSFLTQPVWAQPTNVIDYSKPQNYEIGGIEVVGAQYSDPRTIAALSSLSVGQTIKVPGPDIPRAMQNLWKLRLFTEIDIQAKQRIDNVLYLEIRVTEKPRLARKSFLGVKKGVAEELDKEVSRFATRGSIVTENVLKNTELALKTYFSDKGYPNTKISVVQRPDTLLNNAVMLEYTIDKGEKMRIADIEITGNSVLSDSKIRKMLKETKRIAHLFKKSKYIKADYEKDKEAVIAKYNELGYKDAQILSDSVWTRDGRYMLRLNLLEGNKYYYGNIVFKGNSVYPTNTLREVLNVNKGDIYNSRQLDSRLNYSPDSRDISSLYMDNGYLFFRVDPVETGIHNDTMKPRNTHYRRSASYH
jgi:outer membrane protein insertion porin family